MDVYYGEFNILYKDNTRIDFNIIGYPEVFTIVMENLQNNNLSFNIGSIELQDQVLYEKTEEDYKFYIYIKDNQVYGLKTVADIHFSPRTSQGAYLFEFNHKSDVISLEQTSPIGYSVLIQVVLNYLTHSKFPILNGIR